MWQHILVACNLAQLVEHLTLNQTVAGSIPVILKRKDCHDYVWKTPNA